MALVYGVRQDLIHVPYQVIKKATNFSPVIIVSKKSSKIHIQVSTVYVSRHITVSGIYSYVIVIM